MYNRPFNKFYHISKELKLNIYVGNLSPQVNDEDLKILFSEHGEVSSAKVIRDNYSQESRGFGFVEMPGRTDAQKALDTLKSFELKGNKIVVNEAQPKRERGSGGFGGSGGRRSGGFGGNGGRGKRY
jgi:RNA recognition motif-containing protein